ncbi:TDT family transporter [Bacillus cereus]|uniref:TDT family transporter n=1 Tax=Bacillus cereus TaxID=1396 RepID=UPI0035CA8B13
MTKKLNCIPIPISGLILALFSVAKLQLSFHVNELFYMMMVLGFVLLIGMICKIVFTTKQVLEDLKNPIIAAVSPTFTMAVMVLCSIFIEQSIIWEIIWNMAASFHFILMIYFTYHFILKSEIKMSRIYPSWFIMYVGMAIMPLTAGSLASSMTTVVFWASIVSYIILLPIILIRIFIMRNLEMPTLPLITILCAPGSLSLAAYIAHFPIKSLGLVWALLILSQFLYMIVLCQLPKLLRLSFYPSYAAFTFPLVICATALTNTLKYLGHYGVFGQTVSIIETMIASIMVIYVTIRYGIFFIQQIRPKQPIELRT